MCIQQHSTPLPSPYPCTSSNIQLLCPLLIHVHPATFNFPALSLSMCIQQHSTPQPSPYPCASSNIQLLCPLLILVHPATFSSSALSLSLCIQQHSTPQPSPYPCTSNYIQLRCPLPIPMHPATFISYMFKSHLKTFLFAEAFQQILVLCLKKRWIVYTCTCIHSPVCQTKDSTRVYKPLFFSFFFSEKGLKSAE